MLGRLNTWIEGLYAWAMALSARKDAIWALAFIAFIESSFFPIPPDLLLIPMVLAAPFRAWRIAAVCTIASVLGGLFGYAIGYFLYEGVGKPLFEFYGYAEKFEWFTDHYNEWGFWIVFTSGFSPIPYKVFTIASGLAQMDLASFTLGSVFGRGGRFFLVAGLLLWQGEAIREFIEKRLALMTLVFCVLLVGGVVVLKGLV